MNPYYAAVIFIQLAVIIFVLMNILGQLIVVKELLRRP